MPRGQNPNSKKALAENSKKTQFRGDNAVKNGKKGNEAKKQYKTFKECFKANMTDEMRAELFAMLLNRAKHGNLKAFEILRDTMGEIPKTENTDTANNLAKAQEILGGVESVIN